MTWGISGTQFLALFGGALIVAVIASLVIRRLIQRPPGRSAMLTDSPLTLDQLAYLSGGIGGLGVSALVALRERGEARCLNKRRVRATRRTLSSEATPAQRALHNALVTGELPVRRAGLAIAATPVLAAIRSSLNARRLITSRGQRVAMRLTALLFIALLGVGVLRVVDGVKNHRPVAFLLLLLIPTAIFALIAFKAPAITPAGRSVLREKRMASEPLRSASLPGSRAMAVALFGVGALWLAEPAMAGEFGFARATATASNSNDSGWSDSSSCSSSSSDGGSSSSCGGSSSCGSSCGGGGCGG